MINQINTALLNDVKNRFLPLPRSAAEGLEHEAQKSDFDFLKELGVGSFGQVYLVKHKKTKAIYAIKSIDKSDDQNLEEKANFSREVEIMYKLNHPNIVKLYGHFEDNTYCYFIMQYIPKRSVYELIPKPGKKPNFQLIASVMKDLISAVYYLHNMKPIIIHRDIKPENILLDENSRAYLTDFGWSNYVQSFKRRTTVCGTPLYLPPEMVNELGHDEKADIWCIGVLLFELCTGKVPFDGRDLETVKANILRLNISWPRDIDPEVKDLISQILRLKPSSRLSIEEILSHRFFTKYFPNAVNELIKPEGQQNKIFVISKDDPKTYGEAKKMTPVSSSTSSGGGSNTQNSSKINNRNNSNSSLSNPPNSQRTRPAYVPTTQINLTSSTKESSNNNKNNNNKNNNTNNNTNTNTNTNTNINTNNNINNNNRRSSRASSNNIPTSNRIINTYSSNTVNNRRSVIHNIGGNSSKDANSNNRNNSFKNSHNTSYTSNSQRGHEKYNTNLINSYSNSNNRVINTSNNTTTTSNNHRNSDKNKSIFSKIPIGNYTRSTYNRDNNNRMSYRNPIPIKNTLINNSQKDNNINNNYRMSFRSNNHVNYYSNSNNRSAYNPKNN